MTSSGNHDSESFFSDEEPVITKEFEQYNDAPLIGLEFILELPQDGSEDGNQGFKYHCCLVDKSLEVTEVIPFVINPQRRLHYIKRYFPSVAAKFSRLADLSLWKSATFDSLSQLTNKIEQKFGRLKPRRLNQSVNFVHRKQDVLKELEASHHLRENEELNFADWPDPFASYEMPSGDDVCNNQGECSNVAEDAEATLNRIEDPGMKSLMQREIERFRKSVDIGLSSPAPATTSISSRSNTTTTVSSSSLSTPTSEVLSVNAPAKTGENMAPNMEDQSTIASKGSKEGDSVEIIEETTRGLRDAREVVSLASPFPSKRRSSSRDRRRSRSPRRSSPDRRRYRCSPRRNRTPPRDRRDRRSPRRSPFTVDIERWRSFKVEERSMLDSLDRKRAIFDKRPEDHPRYNEEWRIFWEQRYKELQSQGRDADSHDYKSEWIPHWAKRVAAFFEAEANEKREELRVRSGLRSLEEPRRSHYYGPSTRDATESSSRNASHGSNRRHHRAKERSRSPPSPDRYRRSGKRSRSRSPARQRLRTTTTSPHRSTRQSFEIDLLALLRLLSAVETSLGSLGPQINAILARAVALDKNKVGACNLLLEDADVACILDLVREKLTGQIEVNLIDPAQISAVQNAIEDIGLVLQVATRKRPSQPPDLVGKKGESKASKELVNAKDKLKTTFADYLAKALVHRGMQDIDDTKLRRIIFEVIEGTDLDDGTIDKEYDGPILASWRGNNMPAMPTPGSNLLATGSSASQYQLTLSNINTMPTTTVTLTTTMYNTNPTTSRGAYTTGRAVGATTQANSNIERRSTTNDQQLDDFDDLTLTDLQSLLDNFKNLSRGEQRDLVRYVRRLEKTNPTKVQQLKQAVSIKKEKIDSTEVEASTSGTRAAVSNDKNSQPRSSRSRSPSQTSTVPSSLLGRPPPPPPPDADELPPGEEESPWKEQTVGKRRF